LGLKYRLVHAFTKGIRGFAVGENPALPAGRQAPGKTLQIENRYNTFLE